MGIKAESGALGAGLRKIGEGLGFIGKRAAQFHQAKEAHRMDIEGQKELMTHGADLAGKHEDKLHENAKDMVSHIAGITAKGRGTGFTVGDVTVRGLKPEPSPLEGRANRSPAPRSQKMPRASRGGY